MSFPEKKFIDWYKNLAENSSYTSRSYEWFANHRYLMEAARWGYEQGFKDGIEIGKISRIFVSR